MAVDPASEASLSAKATLDAVLANFGLSSLGANVWGQYLTGVPIEQIMLNIRQTPEYKTRFPGMDALAQRGRAISEAEYISNERQYAQIFRAAGLPQGFYDTPDDFGGFIGGEVSPSEVNTRVQQGIVAVQQAPQEVRQELQRLYGVGPGELTAYFLNPDRALPLLQTQVAASQIAGSGKQTGYGALTQTEAERLAALGVTGAQAQQGFGALVSQQELFAPLPGEAGQAIGREEQLGAAFGGDVAAQQRLETTARRRRAEFAAGGEFAAGAKGVGGLASAAG